MNKSITCQDPSSMLSISLSIPPPPPLPPPKKKKKSENRFSDNFGCLDKVLESIELNGVTGTKLINAELWLVSYLIIIAWKVSVLSVFSRIRTDYGEIRSIPRYSVGMRENAEPVNLRIRTLHTVQCTPNKIHARQTNAGYNVHLNVVLELMAVDRIFWPN